MKDFKQNTLYRFHQCGVYKEDLKKLDVEDKENISKKSKFPFLVRLLGKKKTR